MSVAVLRFHAGSMTFAIAAGSVQAISSARSDAPHLAQVLGGEPGAMANATRVLHVCAHGERVDIVVDGPVELIELEVGDITPCRATTSASVLGFARIGDELCVLLDAATLVERMTTMDRSQQ